MRCWPDAELAPIDPAGIALAAMQEPAKEDFRKDELLAALRGNVVELHCLLQSILEQNQHSFNSTRMEETRK